MEIAFRDVPVGERFVSHKTKRCFGGVKIVPTEVSSRGTIQALEGPSYTANAVIVLNHLGKPAHDAGFLTIMRDDDIVEIAPARLPSKG